jgi:RNA polymerase sigma factor (sigma-70 family)
VVEVLGLVEVRNVPREEEQDVVGWRTVLAQLYEALPVYGTSAFWRALEAVNLPLEVLAKCVRAAIACEDHQGRNRIVEIIIGRVQPLNEYWAKNILKHISGPADERYALICDLHADLDEKVIRALLDPKQLFWEENFLRCLGFERRHVYRSLMVREGYWCDPHVQRGKRVPRTLLVRLGSVVQQDDGDVYTFDIEDKQAQKRLLAIERTDLFQLVLHLPEKLKAVVLLIFWEGRTEKDAAQILGITDRTVRNRIRSALRLLQDLLEGERAGWVLSGGQPHVIGEKGCLRQYPNGRGK